MSEGGADSRSPQELATLLARIRELARACGFSDAGVAAPDLPQAEDGLFGWLDAGYGAGMDWIGRTKDIRVDLRKRFSWARSVLPWAGHSAGSSRSKLSAGH